MPYFFPKLHIIVKFVRTAENGIIAATRQCRRGCIIGTRI